MAGLNVICQADEVALSAATAKTVLQIVAPANQRLKLKEFGVYFDGVSPTAEPALVELLWQTTAGTMTANNPLKEDDSLPETVQSTGQRNATAEPTAGNVVRKKEVHPQGGYEWVSPLGDELNIGGGKRLGMRITAPASVNVVPYMRLEE